MSTDDPDDAPGDPVSRAEFDAQAQSAGALVEIRRWTSTALADLGPAHLTDVVLVAVEIVTNAYDHAGGPGLVRLTRWRDPCRVRIEVADHSPAQPRLLRDPADPVPRSGARPGGGPTAPMRHFGMVLVDQTCQNWGSRVDPEGKGKVVWADITCADQDPCA